MKKLIMGNDDMSRESWVAISRLVERLGLATVLVGAFMYGTWVLALKLTEAHSHFLSKTEELMEKQAVTSEKQADLLTNQVDLLWNVDSHVEANGRGIQKLDETMKVNGRTMERIETAIKDKP